MILHRWAILIGEAFMLTTPRAILLGLGLIAVARIFLPTVAVAQVPLQTLRTCLEIEDQSKERLNCYDEKKNSASTEADFYSSKDSARLPLCKGRGRAS
jgi:hypothetical protein